MRNTLAGKIKIKTSIKKHIFICHILSRLNSSPSHFFWSIKADSFQHRKPISIMQIRIIPGWTTARQPCTEKNNKNKSQQQSFSVGQEHQKQQRATAAAPSSRSLLLAVKTSRARRETQRGKSNLNLHNKLYAQSETLSLHGAVNTLQRLPSSSSDGRGVGGAAAATTETAGVCETSLTRSFLPPLLLHEVITDDSDKTDVLTVFMSTWVFFPCLFLSFNSYARKIELTLYIQYHITIGHIKMRDCYRYSKVYWFLN